MAVTVDGEKVARGDVRLTVNDRTYTLDALETEYVARWEMGAVATVTVMRSGGLAPGKHQLELEERLRISYMPFPTVGKDSKVVTVG